MNMRASRMAGIAALVAAFFSAGALAATAAEPLATSAWRCGPDGRVYSDAPCPGGRQLALPAPRPEADVQAAKRLAVRERALGEQLKREREARETAGVASSARRHRSRDTRAAAERSNATAPRAELPKTKKAKAPSFDKGNVTWQATSAVAAHTPR
jgi:hypothetical protein